MSKVIYLLYGILLVYSQTLYYKSEIQRLSKVYSKEIKEYKISSEKAYKNKLIYIRNESILKFLESIYPKFDKLSLDKQKKWLTLFKQHKLSVVYLEFNKDFRNELKEKK